MAQSQKPELQIERKSFGKVDFEHSNISDAVKQGCTDAECGLSDTEAKK